MSAHPWTCEQCGKPAEVITERFRYLCRTCDRSTHFCVKLKPNGQKKEQEK